MSKESINDFFKKVAESPVLSERLEAMQNQYTEQIVTLAKENGFDVTPEDFTETLSCLSDEEMETVSGGYAPRSSSGAFMTDSEIEEADRKRRKHR